MNVTGLKFNDFGNHAFVFATRSGRDALANAVFMSDPNYERSAGGDPLAEFPQGNSLRRLRGESPWSERPCGSAARMTESDNFTAIRDPGWVLRKSKQQGNR